jgi:hypothetical protein
MVRRIGALLVIATIVSLILILMWRVYVHHRNAGSEGEPTNVYLHRPPRSSLAAETAWVGAVKDGEGPLAERHPEPPKPRAGGRGWER